MANQAGRVLSNVKLTTSASLSSVPPPPPRPHPAQARAHPLHYPTTTTTPTAPNTLLRYAGYPCACTLTYTLVRAEARMIKMYAYYFHVFR